MEHKQQASLLRSLLALPHFVDSSIPIGLSLKQLILGPYARCRFHPTLFGIRLECFQRLFDQGHLLELCLESVGATLFIPEGMIRSFARKLTLNAMNPELTDPPPSFATSPPTCFLFSSKRPNERFCHANPCSFRSPSRHPTPIPLPFSKRFTKRTNPSATLRSLPTNFPSPAPSLSPKHLSMVQIDSSRPSLGELDLQSHHHCR